MAKYLIIECEEIGECEEKEPICLTDDYDKYNKYGYEIYKINNDNSLTKVRDYDSVTTTKMGVYYWDDDSKVGTTEPIVLETWDGNRDNITKSQIKKLKEKYHFSSTAVEEIYTAITCWGNHGEEIDGKWTVIGQIEDDHYCIGY